MENLDKVLSGSLPMPVITRVVAIENERDNRVKVQTIDGLEYRLNPKAVLPGLLTLGDIYVLAAPANGNDVQAEEVLHRVPVFLQIHPFARMAQKQHDAWMKTLSSCAVSRELAGQPG